MTDTSKDVERLHLTIDGLETYPYGDYVRHSDYAAQLAEANARADRARDDALAEAVGAWLREHGDRIDEPTEWLCDQLVKALRTQPTPSVEPVTVQVAARQSAEQRAAKLLLEACEEASPLDDLIQTAMDRAAFTDGTSEWVFNFRAALRAIAEAKP